MKRWEEFALAAPELAAFGRTMIHQFGTGLGYLATVRRDGGPRMHPFCPIRCGPGLYGLIVESPKLRDLLRDGRVAIHTFPSDKSDNEFHLTGRARLVEDATEVAAVRTRMTETGSTSTGDERCFEFLVDSAMSATYKGHGDWPPVYATWRAPK